MNGAVDQTGPGIRLTIGRRVVTGKRPRWARRVTVIGRPSSHRFDLALINWG